jgi:putative tryptophan/tyrosine transport system substrate-binding protein
VRLNVDLILASGEQTTPALLELTRTVPIVQPTLMDPVERGYVKSLARPGGNLTGLSLRVDPAISGKLLELLKELAPRISRVAVLHQTTPAGARPSASFFEAMVPAATRLRVTLLPAVVNREEEFGAAFTTIESQQADGLIIDRHPLAVWDSGGGVVHEETSPRGRRARRPSSRNTFSRRPKGAAR